jgi:ribosomal protein S18 acetylase RimI-like enzyme
MLTFKNCTEASNDEIYAAFIKGFSDYIIKLEMSKEAFAKRFFGPEGNELKYSFIALEGSNPVGVILGGIKEYEGIKTMRCGTLCIHPDYRRQGISQKLFDLHKQCAKANGCRQLFLEVIVGNDKAISFYKKQGYEKLYDISYYSNSEPASIAESVNSSVEVKEISFTELKSLESEIRDIHINWQNDFDYLGRLEDQVSYGVFEGSKLVAALSGNNRGGINFLWVKPELRLKGIGKSLIKGFVQNIKPQRLAVSFTNNANLTGFLKRVNFNKDTIAQYEMYLTL